MSRFNQAVKRWPAAVLLMVSPLLLAVAPADAAVRIYYSIHMNSFVRLEDAHRQVNALRNRGKHVFWKKVKAPGERTYYRVYLGVYGNQDQALAFWEKLRAEGVVNYFGVHLFKESVPERKHGSRADTCLKLARWRPAPGDRLSMDTDRFFDNGDGTVTDRTTGLMWVKNGWRSEFKSAVTWWDALQKAHALKAGGHDDWRLPTVAEWSSLLDPGQQFPALVEPNPFENMISHMPYWTKTEFAYGKDYTCNDQCPVEAYTVLLYAGTVIHQNKSSRAFVMPVRKIGEGLDR